MSTWLPRRYPDRYALESGGAVLRLPTLGDGWSFDIKAAKGLEALRMAAVIAQEELCLVSEGGAEGPEEAKSEGSTGLVHRFDAGAVCFSFDPQARHRKLMAQVLPLTPWVGSSGGRGGVEERGGRNRGEGKQPQPPLAAVEGSLSMHSLSLRLPVRIFHSFPYPHLSICLLLPLPLFLCSLPPCRPYLSFHCSSAPRQPPSVLRIH